jgi:hypothetical protein
VRAQEIGDDGGSRECKKARNLEQAMANFVLGAFCDSDYDEDPQKFAQAIGIGGERKCILVKDGNAWRVPGFIRKRNEAGICIIAFALDT